MRKFAFILVVVLVSGFAYQQMPQVAQSVRAIPGAVSAVLPQSIPTQGTDLLILHLDVGQGDATLILGPETGGSRVAVLMDAGDIPNGGDKDGGAIVAEALNRYDVRRLDYFIASHYDADHIGGLISGRASLHGTGFVFGADGAPGNVGDDDADGNGDWLDDDGYQPDPNELGTRDDVPIRYIVDRGLDRVPDTQTYRKYDGIANALGERVSIDTQLKVDQFEIDLGGGARMICYAADGHVRNRNSRVRYVNTENERSLCFLIAYGGFHYLIGGDTIGRRAGSENARVEREIGEALVTDGINVDVYHVNHHGADNGSSDDFLELIRPEIAIISLGDGNSHGHPHADTLKRLAEAGVRTIYQTETGTTAGQVPSNVASRQVIVNGDILLTSNGSTYRVMDVESNVDN